MPPAQADELTNTSPPPAAPDPEPEPQEPPIGVEVRPLRTSDIFAVLRIARAALQSPEEVRRLFDRIQDLAKAGEADEGGSQGAVMALVALELVERAEAPMIEWLADMATMTVEEFSESPPTVLVDTIRAIREQEGAADFFAKVQALF